MARRRPSHGLKYYEKALAEAENLDEVLRLRSEAAHQPLSKLSQKSYERIFWQAQERIRHIKKGE